MSKFRVNVCLAPTAPAEVRKALAAAMEPFDVNLDGHNPQGEWDWWKIHADDVRLSTAYLDTLPDDCIIVRVLCHR